MNRALAGGSVAMLFVAAYAPALAQGLLTGAARDKVIADTKAGCVGDYNADPAFKLIPAAVEKYCHCVAVDLTAVLTADEVKSGKTTRSMETRIKAVGRKCLPLLKAGVKQYIDGK